MPSALPSRPRTSRQAAHHSSGSCCDHPGRGSSSGYDTSARSIIDPSLETTTPLRAVVPTSRPMNRGIWIGYRRAARTADRDARLSLLQGRAVDRPAARRPERDTDHPEDWVGSVTMANNLGRDEPEAGLSRLEDGRLLRDAIAADPEDWLGPAAASGAT